MDEGVWVQETSKIKTHPQTVPVGEVSSWRNVVVVLFDISIFNFVDFCHDSAIQAGLIALAASKVRYSVISTTIRRRSPSLKERGLGVSL